MKALILAVSLAAATPLALAQLDCVAVEVAARYAMEQRQGAAPNASNDAYYKNGAKWRELYAAMAQEAATIPVYPTWPEKYLATTKFHESWYEKCHEQRRDEFRNSRR